MRIGIDASVLRTPPRGVGVYLSNLLARFSSLAPNDEFFLYTPSKLYIDFKHNNYIIKLGKPPLNLLGGTLWLKINSALRRNADNLSVFFSPAHILPPLPQRIKTVLTVHDLVAILYPETMANYNRLVHRIYFKQSIIRAHKIIAVSEWTKKLLCEYFSLQPEKISVIYEGYDESFRVYPKSEIQFYLRQLNITEPYILSVGTIEPRKNYPCLIRAFKKFSSTFMLVIAGKHGWKTDSVMDLIKQLGLKHRVRILGYVSPDKLPYLYNGAEIFVIPSLYEGFGLPLLEAMACGLPIVASKSSSFPEIGGDACLYFDPSDPTDLAEKMDLILSNSVLKEKLMKKAQNRAREFSWESCAQKTLAVLKQ
ncbi:MAG: glycosyltransferase family 4 protein [candidate division WOR-3 bacterium]|nr:glycosyltransferase family 4 protein [candidate division WOR-3 bacterium]MCX7757802.1 glycosyltransferase family 4 protein [candidate division WOR-3 bacterium]MDW7987199.1 glycosyltransferase family 1 protein [candidate division WOR-3 bacterium]